MSVQQPVLRLALDKKEIQGLDENDRLTVNERGTIGAMLYWQDQLSRFLGCYSLGERELTTETLGQLVVEAGEALAPFLTRTKPWKPQDIDWAKTDEEMADVLHFALTYFNIRHFSEEQVIALYRQKNLINYRRVQEKMLKLQ